MSKRPEHIIPLTEAEERLLRELLNSGENSWSVDHRLTLARLFATLDAERDESDGLRVALQRCEEGPFA